MSQFDLQSMKSESGTDSMCSSEDRQAAQEKALTETFPSRVERGLEDRREDGSSVASEGVGSRLLP
jgi:hypothetical protein